MKTRNCIGLNGDQCVFLILKVEWCIRKMQEVCQAFSIKLWFRFRENRSLWAKSLWTSYCKHLFPGKVPAKKTDSQVWRRMLKVATLDQANCFWLIGSGKCFFWEDEWSEAGK